ncbi:MAG: hypothetical protein K6E37_05000 [Bacteroidales bacterium]|nr:hypothetical protein [Bacteroidales bacterium]
MFVRRKHNKSGTTSVQVVAKVSGKYRVQKSFGCSRDETTLASLERKARQWADEHEFGEELFIYKIRSMTTQSHGQKSSEFFGV